MNSSALNLILFSFLFGSNTVLADTGKVIISSPADGATVGSYYKTEVKYLAKPGREGDHLHLSVDGKRVEVIHKLQGRVLVDALPPGKHRICLAVNSKRHVPTGADGCINVTSI